MRPLFLLHFALLILVSSTPVHAEIFKWKDEHGRIHYSDQAPSKSPQDSVQTVELSPINSYQRVEISVMEANFTDTGKQRSKTVIMYSTERCGYCKKARAYFKANNISYKEYDIEKSKAARREFDRLNGTGVPVILVGNKRMNGFSEKRFARLYES